jgi:hypothetical protein
MKKKLLLAGVLVASLETMGCFARPLLFWRDPIINGQARLAAEPGNPATAANRKGVPADPPAANVTLNFINLDGRIEDSLVSVQTDALGKYRSPKLLPGNYTVEAMLQGYVIEKATILLRPHEYKRVDFALVKIGEAKSRSMKEAEEDNIQAPGQVRITKPKL